MRNSAPERLHFYLASDPDTKYLHAEVYYGNFSLCHIDTEQGEFGIHFSADPRINPNHESVTANLNEFIETLTRAKEELLKFTNGIDDSH
jgi:hypothetical protein